MLKNQRVFHQGPSSRPNLGLKIEARWVPVSQPSGSLLMLQLPSRSEHLVADVEVELVLAQSEHGAHVGAPLRSCSQHRSRRLPSTTPAFCVVPMICR